MSTNSLSIQVLKNCVLEMQRTGKISSTTKTELDSYLDEINKNNFYVSSYSDFDATSSDAEIVFNSSTRTATNSEGVAKEIVWEISLSDIQIKSLKLGAVTTQDVTWYLSYNGTDFFEVDSYDICEEITSDSFYVKISTPDNVVEKIIVNYINI